MLLINSFKTARERILGKDYQKTAVVVLLVLLCAGATCYFHFILHREMVFSHLFYVPIVLAGFWWGRRGVWVAVLLGALLLASHFLSDTSVPALYSFLRAVMFVVVGLTVGILREQGVRGEKNLRETRDYLDSLIRYANASIIVWNPAGRITRFNHAFERLTGYKADDVIGQELRLLFPEASRGESLHEIARTLSGEHWESVEIPILRQDGETRLALWSFANIHAEDGATLLATIAQGQDITERKRAEEEVRRRSKELAETQNVLLSLLEDVDQARQEVEQKVVERTRELRETQAQLIQAGKMAALGQLAGGVAHELNNPLTGVLMYAKRLLKRVDNEGLKDNEAFRVFPESLRVIDEAAIRCKTITDSLLTFSRQAKFEFAPLDVNQVIENTLTLIRSQLKFHRITLIQELQPDLPPVVGNPNQLQQVFTNIIINAQQSMADGGRLVIKTSEVSGKLPKSSARSIEPPGWVTVSFTDTGSGIPEENLDKIFEPFFTTRPVGQGTGLGLSISYGIVDAHTGFIEVQSQVGVGSTFSVFLPVGDASSSVTRTLARWP